MTRLPSKPGWNMLQVELLFGKIGSLHNLWFLPARIQREAEYKAKIQKPFVVVSQTQAAKFREAVTGVDGFGGNFGSARHAHNPVGMGGSRTIPLDVHNKGKLPLYQGGKQAGANPNNTGLLSPQKSPVTIRAHLRNTFGGAPTTMEELQYNEPLNLRISVS